MNKLIYLNSYEVTALFIIILGLAFVIVWALNMIRIAKQQVNTEHKTGESKDFPKTFEDTRK